MFTGLFWLTLACALADWFATGLGWIRIRWVTKPGTLVLLIAWFTQAGGWHGPLVWFGLGLVFSLAGDVLLELPQRLFLAGLAAFLLAHLAYIAGFVNPPLAVQWQFLFPILAILVGEALPFRRILAGIKQQPKMRTPVISYALVLTLMLICAISTLFRPGWRSPAAVLVSLGAGLFFLSDMTLAYTRFAGKVPASHLLVMITYHLGQILITCGVLIQNS